MKPSEQDRIEAITKIFDLHFCPDLYDDEIKWIIAADPLTAWAKSQEWIPVSERLPDVDICKSWYGLVSDGRCVMTAVYWLKRWNSLTGEKEFVWSENQSVTNDLTRYITHWRPLPAPPEPSL